MRKPAFLSNERLSRFLVSMLLAMGLLLPLMFTFEAESALALAIAAATVVTVLCTALGTLRRGRLVLGIVGGALLAVQLVLPHMGLIGWAMEAFKAVSLYLNGVTAAAPLFARQLGLTLGVTVAGISYLFSSRNVGFLPATILVVLMLFGMWSLCQADVVKLSDEEVDFLWGCSPQEGARRLLEECGCTVIAIPCNTSHFFADQLQKELEAPLIHMPRETVAVLARSGKRKVGVLATDGTVQTGVYQKECAAQGILAVAPPPEVQKLVMGIIYDEIKRGEKGSREKFAVIDRWLRGAGCDSAILACTELSVYRTYHGLPDYYLDAMDVLAERCITACGYKLRMV